MSDSSFKIKTEIETSGIESGFKSINSFISESEKKISEYDKQLADLGEGNFFSKEYQKISKKRDMLASQIESLNKMLDVDVSAGKLKGFTDALDDLNKKGVNAKSIERAASLDSRIKELDEYKTFIEGALRKETAILETEKGRLDEANARILDSASKGAAESSLQEFKNKAAQLDALVKGQERYNTLVNEEGVLQKNIRSLSMIPGQQGRAESLKAQLDSLKEEKSEIEGAFSKAGVSLGDDLVPQLQEAQRQTKEWEKVLFDSRAASDSLVWIDKRIGESSRLIEGYKGKLDEVNSNLQSATTERATLPIDQESINAFNEASKGAELWKEMLQEDSVALMTVGKMTASLTNEVEKQEASEIKAAQAAEDRARRIEITNNRESRAAEESAQRIEIANNREVRAAEESAQRVELAKNKDLRAQEMHEASISALNNREIRAEEKHAADLEKVAAQTESIRANDARKHEESIAKLESINNKEEREQERHAAKMEKAAADLEKVTAQTASISNKDARGEEMHESRLKLNDQKYEINAQKEAGRQLVFQQKQQDRVNKQISGFGSSVSSMVSTVLRSVVRVGAAFINVGKMAVNAGTTIAKKFGGALASVSKVSVKALTPVAKAITSVGKSLLGINLVKSVGESIGGLFKRISRLASLAFVFRVLTQGFRQLKNDIVEAFGTYLNYDSTLNSSVNTLKANFSTLKAQLASAFAPILQIIVPALSTFVGWCVTAANAVSAFIAALTGQSTWKKAVVNSVGAVGDAASGAADDLSDAADKADELKEKLGNYDKLNVIDDESSSSKSGKGSGGGGGSGAASGAGISYEDVKIGDEIANLADKIKEMWKNADFTELGGMVGDYLKNSLDSIKWGPIKDAAYKVGSSVATFLNGFFETPGLAQSIGRTLGETLNTGISLAEGFVQNFHWDSFGTFLKDGINTMVDTVEWERAGGVVRDGMNGIITAFNRLTDPTDGVNFFKLGSSIGTFVSTALSLNWNDLQTAFKNTGIAFGEFVNGLTSAGTLTSIGTLIGNFFKGIATSVSNFINTTNFAQLGRDVGGGVKAIGDGISQGLDELTQLDLSGKLDEFFTNFFNTVTEEDFKKWGTSLGGFLGHSLSELITTIHHWLPLVCANIGVFIDAMINAFAGQMTADKFKELGETLSSFVSGAVGKIGEWLDKPENANGIALRLKGFLDGLTEGWDPDSFRKLGAGIRRVLFKIIQTIRQWAIDEGNIKMAVKSLKLFFVGLFDANGDGQISFSEIKEFVDTIFGLLLDAIKEVFDGDKAVGALALFFLVLKSGIIKKIAMIGLAKSIGKSIVGGASKEITAKGLLSGLSSSSVEAAALPIGTALAAAIIGAATGEWTRKEGLWLKGSDKEVYDALTSVTGKRGGKKDKIAKDIATTLSGEAGYTDEVYGSMSRVWQAIARAQESIDPAKWGDLKQALVDLRESGTLTADAAEDVDYWITRLGTDSNMVSISVDGFNKSISESAVEADKSKVSYKNISDAVDYLKTSAGFSGDALSDLDYILNRNDVDAATKYQMIDEILRNSGEDGEKFSNIFKNYVNAELKNVAENINKIETTDLHKKLDELASSGKISYDELWRLKGLTEHQIGRDAFTTLIEQLGMSAENADALKELIASQLGIEIGKLGENADLVAGTLNELLNPDGTEEGQTKVDGILDLLGIKLDKMAEKGATVEVKGDTTDVDEKLTSTEEKADEVDGKTVTIVEEADSTGVEEEFVALDSSVEERDGETVTIKVDGTAEDLRTLLENTETDINLFKNTDGEVVIEFNGVSYAFDATSEEVKAVIAEYEGKTATTEFVGDNQVGAAVKAANDDASTVDDEKVITFKGNDEVSQEADNVKTKMDETPSEKQISFVNVGGALLATFITTVLSLALATIPDEKKITFTVDNQTEEPIGAIKTSLSEVQTHMSNVVAPALKQDFQTVFSAAKGYANQALTGGGGITSAISFMQSDIRNKLGAIPGMFQTVFESARQTAVNAIQAIQSAINGLTGKKVYVTVDENGTVAWVKRIIDTIPDSHTVTIYANWVGDTDRSFYATVYWENVNRAIGGILRNGIWQNLPSYAGGTAKAHGTIFRAGEAGAEIVGNVNGRTEVLNKSQIASAIYSAVKSAMAEGLTEVGNALISNIIGAANSINMNLGHLITEYQSQNSVEAYRLAFAGLDDIGALSSYKSTEGGFGSWDLNDLKDALSGDFYINNEMTLDGKVIYKEMVTIDRQAVRLTGRSGFGGR